MSGDADAVVAAVDPGLTPPAVRRREVVLVTGPWLAGTSSLVDALRERMPDTTFVESDELAPGEAAEAVLFVVSAVTPLTQSDCALADLVTAHTDLVIGVVSKIDAHRGWRDVLAANAALLGAHSAHYRSTPWVGVAASPYLGEPRLDELTVMLRDRLADPGTAYRNRLRAWETRLETIMGRHRADGTGADREATVTSLGNRREEIRRERRLSKSQRGIALRSQIQQARVQLAYFARGRCASVRTELQEDVAALSRRNIADFEAYVRRRADEVVTEVNEGITELLADVAGELGTVPSTPNSVPVQPVSPELPHPPLTSRRLETRLMMVLGAGFGLGVALAVSRLCAGPAPGLTVAGLIVGGVVGLLITVWVVGIRGVLYDRAVLDRWVTDITGTLRSWVEQLVATRVLAAETALTSGVALLDEQEGASAAERIAEIDVELRDHAVATAQAAAVRDRRLPVLQQALDAVRVTLYGALEDGSNGSGRADASEKAAP